MLDNSLAMKFKTSIDKVRLNLMFSKISLQAMLESERAAIEEQDKMRKQQMLLGPSSALASAQNAPLPPSPA